MKDKEKIRAKIERLLNKKWKWCSSIEAKFRCEVYRELLEFIDSLPEEQVSKDLEESAKEYEDNLGYYECMSQWPGEAFIAGAQWQKEQMMKKAVDGNIVNTQYPTQVQLNTYTQKFKDGDNVKIIIIKEEKK